MEVKRAEGLTGSEARLLFSLAEVGVGVEVGLQRGGVRGLAPALPLDQVGHPALSHGRGLGHMVLDHLGNPCQREKKQVELRNRLAPFPGRG